MRWAVSAACFLTVATLQAVLRPGDPLPANALATRVVIEKGARRLTLLQNVRALKTYRVALGSDPVGHKQQEGDGRTPEGSYVIDAHKPDSAFHRALHVSYPNAADRAAAAARGVSPGGAIMIHGLPNHMAWLGSLHTLTDWTQGCIAVTNEEIEELWRAVPDGTPVEITP